MRYISTRGGIEPQPFTSILLEGLAADGGLAVPQSYPRFTASDLARLRPLGYRELAFEILSGYIDDIAADDLQQIIDRTYTAQIFGSDDIALCQRDPEPIIGDTRQASGICGPN